MTGKLILYDLANKGQCACWSLNTWKTRLDLNFLEIEYETQWLEREEIAPKFSVAGLAPNETGPAYTLPTVQMPDGTLIQDSATIARALQQLCKNGQDLHLDDAGIAEADKAIADTFAPLLLIVLPAIARNLLNPDTIAAARKASKERFGMTFEEMEESEGVATAWEDAEVGLEGMKRLLGRDGEGPFVLGGRVGHANFVLVGAMQFVRRIDEGFFERFVRYDGSLLRLYDACEQWLERDDR